MFAFALRRPGAVSVIAALAVSVGVSVTAAPADGSSSSLDRTLRDSRISESSGIARSSYDRSTVFTHNDSGDSPRVFAVDQMGQTKAVLTLDGARARDWEDIAVGPNHRLYVGDIGDNARARDSIQVYRFTEPQTLASKTVTATRYDFRYPDGRHDAEGLMVNPVTGRIYVVTKAASGAGIYAAPSTPSTTQSNRLTRVASAPPYLTSANFAPDGSRFVLSSGGKNFVYRSIGGSPVTMVKPWLKQGESVEISRGGGTILMGSEGSQSPVLKMPMP
jgi:hypothetical protein